MAKKKPSDGRDRLMSALASSLPDGGGGYQLSSAFSGPERRRLLGAWTVAEHRVEGRPYIESFAATALRGLALLEPVYASIYDFREALCVKRVMISGLVELPEGRAEYSFRMSMAISWDIGPGCLLVRPELGYQSTSLAGKPAAVKEFGSTASVPGGTSRIGYRFEGEQLLLEEGLDFKRLCREAE
jgi:hypothetical protein